MQLVKLITSKRIKTLRCQTAYKQGLSLAFLILFFSQFSAVYGQDNSPYSRYGIGDIVPSTNIANRGMAGIAAGHTDVLSINFNNPASYTSFQAAQELKSKKLSSGRAILDIGINLDNRTLIEPGNPNRFKASNALFSYVQIGMPLSKNWGFSFGLKPVSRISYNIYRTEMLKDPVTGLPIDTALTRNQGSGGSYLASAGAGVTLFRREKHLMEEKLSIGLNGGFLFGEKDYSTRRDFLNDTVAYYKANYETKTNFGGLYFTAGLQYKLPVSNKMMLTLGAYGNWGQKIKGSQDILRETYIYDDNAGNIRLDSVYDRRDLKGNIELPAQFTVGFVLQKFAVPNKEGGWLIGVDFNKQNWDNYRFYGQKDSVKTKWDIKIGGQFNPVPKRNYFSNVAYRFGLFTGPDYIKVGQKLSQLGVTFGLGLPVAISRQAPNQTTYINMAFEYSKRGNNDNVLKENMFRFSLGFSLSDIWFIKRKYD